MNKTNNRSLKWGAIALAVVLVVMCLSIANMQIRISNLTMDMVIAENRISNLINSQPKIADNFNHLLEQMDNASQNTNIMRCICVVSKSDADCYIFDCPASSWLNMVTGVWHENSYVYGLDMNIFCYTPSDDIVYPDEVQEYIEANYGREISQCSYSDKEDYNVAFFADNLPVLLYYKQQWDGSENSYALKLKMFCGENSERVINFEIEGVERAKVVHSEEYIEGVGRDLLVFIFGGRYYCINEEMKLFEITSE